MHTVSRQNDGEMYAVFVVFTYTKGIFPKSLRLNGPLCMLRGMSSERFLCKGVYASACRFFRSAPTREKTVSPSGGKTV